MREDVDLIGGELQATGQALVGKRAGAVDGGDVGRVGPAAVGMPGEQHAQLLKTFADGGNRLRQVQVTLAGAAAGLGVRSSVAGVNASAGEHIGAGREAGGHGAACHQHFEALRTVAQQQHGGGRTERRILALGVQELGRSDHAGHYLSRALAARR